MASGDRLHNFPSTISLCSETKRGTFAHQCHKYVTKLSASLHQKKKKKKLASLKGFPEMKP